MIFFSLISQSADGTVFFFNFTPKGLNPIGFVNVKEEITFMTWTPTQYVRKILIKKK